MTENQQELVSKNVNLMYSFMKNKYDAGVIPYYIADDFTSDLGLRFCSSAMKYDDETGFKFSTYAYGGFEMCCRDICCRKISMYNRNNFISQDFATSLMDSVPDVELKFVEEGALWSLIHKTELTERELLILKSYYIEGKSMPMIGREIGLCKERISQIRKESLLKIKKMASIEGLSLSDFYER